MIFLLLLLLIKGKIYNNTLGLPSKILKCLGFFFFENLLLECKETEIKSLPSHFW
jgi:hypothetical protein